MKFMFPAIITGLATASLLALTGSSNMSSVYFETATNTIEVGSVFPVVVYADVTTPVNAVEITVEFTKSKVDVFGVDRGQSVLTIWTADPEIDTTSVKLSGGTFKRGFLGKHQIATLNFRALEPGQYTIEVKDVNFVAGDGEGTEVLSMDDDRMRLSLLNFDENTDFSSINFAVKDFAKTDVNGDGKITLKDISAFMGAWSSRSQTMDFNGDGRMSFRDFSIILADFFNQ